MTEHVFTGWDRKDVQVLVDGTWHPGELRSWDAEPDGGWTAMVTWSAGPSENRLDRFPAESIRPVAS